MKKVLNFIDGKYLEPKHSEFMSSMNPALGEVHLMLPDSTAEDIELAVQAAKKALPAWQNTSVKDRAAILLRVADLIEKNAERLANAESEDQGKPVWLVREMDVPRTIANFRYFSGLMLQHSEPTTWTETPTTAMNYNLRRPVGVVGLISPWNLPLYLLTWKLAPALAMGNTIVAKPSEMTSLTAYLLTEILQEAGVPKGVANFVFGTGSKAGQALVEHPDVPAISFTGGTVTGKKIAQTTAPMLKKLSLELGGKNPNIIFADCDWEQMLKTTLRSSFLNQGEICLCGSRILVEESVYDKFLNEFVERAKKIKVGDPKNPDSFMGALISEQHMQKVLSYFDIAKETGAKILCGGKRSQQPEPFNKGYFVEPTVIADVKIKDRIFQEEIFGPVVSVTPFKSKEEAIELANGVSYGLSASVWTQSMQVSQFMSRELDVGTVWVNTWMLRDLRVPFGGVKGSGLGREGGEHSIEFYTEVKNVCVKV